MPAHHYRYVKDSLTITPTGASAIDVDGVQSLRFGQGGETIDLMSDASELVQEIPLHRIKGRLTISTLDQGVIEIPLGACAVTFDIQRVKNGRGAVTGAGKTIAFPACVLKDIDSGAGSSAGETSSLSLDAADDGSGNIYTVTDEA